MVPVFNNYDLQCGSKLELKILPKSADPNGPVTLTISADNVDETQENAVKHVEYTVVIVPVARLEIVSEKTTIKVGVFQKLYTFVQIEVFSWKTSTSH